VLPSVRVEATEPSVLFTVARVMWEIEERHDRAGWAFTVPVLYRVLSTPGPLVARPMRLNSRAGEAPWHTVVEWAWGAATCAGDVFDVLFPWPLVAHVFFAEVPVADAREEMAGVRVRVVVAVVGGSLLILQRARATGRSSAGMTTGVARSRTCPPSTTPWNCSSATSARGSASGSDTNR
jgi:hypothetical protein